MAAGAQRSPGDRVRIRVGTRVGRDHPHVADVVAAPPAILVGTVDGGV